MHSRESATAREKCESMEFLSWSHQSIRFLSLHSVEDLHLYGHDNEIIVCCPKI